MFLKCSQTLDAEELSKRRESLQDLAACAEKEKQGMMKRMGGTLPDTNQAEQKPSWDSRGKHKQFVFQGLLRSLSDTFWVNSKHPF